MKTTYFYKIFIFVLALGCSPSLNAHAQQMHKKMHKNQKKEMQPKAAPPAKTTKGSVKINGKAIEYNARAGTISLTDSHQDTTAHIFYTAYIKRGVNDHSQRPVMFFYNGGPGSSTMWLHMGSFSPVRVGTEDTTKIAGAPYSLKKNHQSLLNVTDLVFVDAPATGFSRIVGKGKDKDYLGVDQDAKAFSQFIKRYISKYNRWNSPKYLFGESYGTTRSAVLANRLVTRENIDLNGIVLLSQILNFGNSVDGPKRNPGNDRPFELALPTYAATAWYHHKLPNRPDDLESFLQKVEHFAMTDYASALAQGSKLSESELNQMAQKLHQYTGLSTDYIKKANLRVDGGEFEKNLLGKSGETTGRLDTRFRGPSLDPLSESSEYDPQSSTISSAYVTVFNNYVRNTLHYGRSLQYRPTHYSSNWDFDHHGSIGLNVMPDLANAMKHDPRLHIMLTGGYYDLATPFYEGMYEMHHLPIPKRLQKNISYQYYKSGHMVYVHPPSLKKMHDDVTNFIKQTDNLKN